MQTGTVTFTLNLPAVFREEFGWVVGEFPTLGVASQGHTREEAERNLIEAAQLFIESCFERNRLDAALKELGLKPGHADDQLLHDHLTVPVELLSLRNGSTSHAC